MVAVAIAVFLIVLAWWNILSAQAGLTVRWFQQEGVPMVYLAPQGVKNAPGVLVAHGYSGSKQLMLGYGTGLARAQCICDRWIHFSVAVFATVGVYVYLAAAVSGFIWIAGNGGSERGLELCDRG